MGFEEGQLPPTRWTRSLVPIAATYLLAAISMCGLAGCGRSPAEAENREVRLTSDGEIKFATCVSPDGKWIAYAQKAAGSEHAAATYVIPRQGGEPKRISPDTLSLYPLAWANDGKGTYCRQPEGPGIYYLTLDGTVRHVRDREAVTRLITVSADGETELVTKFNQDNRDVAIRKSGGKAEFLVQTPSWEEDAVFGPGPGDVTVVSMPSYMAPTSTISTWSPETRALKPLPLPAGSKNSPRWSADGRYLSFSLVRRGQSDLFVYDAKSGVAAAVTDDPDDESGAAWTPQGDGVVFCRSRKESHIFSGFPGSPDRVQLTTGPARDYGPMASPDGQWVAFFRRTPGGSQGQDQPTLCVMPATGGEVRTLDLRGLMLPEKPSDALAWSHDSRHLAFNASDGSSKMDIYRIGRDGSGLARVTVTPGEEVEPRWSPDGRWISFTQAGSGRLEVAIVPANGGLTKVVSPEGMRCEGSVWSPNSDRVGYLNIRGDGFYELWISPLAGASKPSRVAESKTVIWPLYWPEDGEILAAHGKGNLYDLVAFATTTGAETTMGTHATFPSGRDMFYKLSPAGEKYRKLIYPAGLIAADGEDQGDLFFVPIHPLPKTRALSARTQTLHWYARIGSAGYF